MTALNFKAFGALVASGDEWEIELEAEALIEKSGAEDELGIGAGEELARGVGDFFAVESVGTKVGKLFGETAIE